jgi:hypothetical protein
MIVMILQCMVATLTVAWASIIIYPSVVVIPYIRTNHNEYECEYEYKYGPSCGRGYGYCATLALDDWIFQSNDMVLPALWIIGRHAWLNWSFSSNIMFLASATMICRKNILIEMNIVSKCNAFVILFMSWSILFCSSSSSAARPRNSISNKAPKKWDRHYPSCASTMWVGDDGIFSKIRSRSSRLVKLILP